MNEANLSLIVCTFNRAAFLRRLLLSLVGQCKAEEGVEIIVVDNNSRDMTAAVTHSFDRMGVPLKYVFEPKQGLSNARNAGAEAAIGKHLLFLDDDALAPAGFVAAMLNVVRTHDPDFFGGPIYPIYADRMPRGFPEELEIREKARHSGFHRDVTMSGGNFGVRKATLSRLGGFDPKYGMIGNQVGMLEERLLVDAYKNMTPITAQKLYYKMEAFVFHHTPAARLTYKFQAKRIAVAEYQMSRHILSQGLRAPKMYYRAVFDRLIESIGEFGASRLSLRCDRVQKYKAAIKVARTFAVARACADHGFSLFTRSSEDKTRPLGADAPLRLLWVKMSPQGDEMRDCCRECKDQLSTAEILNGLPVTVDIIQFDKPPRNKDLNARIIKASPSAFDAILFDNEIPEGTARITRAHYPHLQFLVRLTRTKLLSAIENIDASGGRVRALIQNFPALRDAFQKDRASVRYADLVVTSSHWERRIYLRWFGPRSRFVHAPIIVTNRLRKLAERNRTAAPHQRNKQAVIVSGLSLSHFEARQSFRAAQYFRQAQLSSADLVDWTCQVAGKAPKDSIRSTAREIRLSGLLNTPNLYELLSRSSALLIGDSFKAGSPTRLLEAVLCGAVIVAPRSCLRRLEPALRPFAEGYKPGNGRSLASALQRSHSTDGRPWDTVDQAMRAEATKSWSNIVHGCRRWIRHSPPRAATDLTNADPTGSMADARTTSEYASVGQPLTKIIKPSNQGGDKSNAALNEPGRASRSAL